jgi:tRNA pseudouridine38-40 synthase
MMHKLKNEQVSVLDIKQVPQTYVARYTAQYREYMYRILEVYSETDPANNNPFYINRVWFYDTENGTKILNIDAMYRASRFIVGQKLDMSSFVKASAKIKAYQNWEHLERTIDSIEFEVMDNLPTSFNPLQFSKYYREVRIHFKARSFLHNQIRILVYLLARIGRGDFIPEKMIEIINMQSRYYTDKCAPPHGLYLMNVKDE